MKKSVIGLTLGLFVLLAMLSPAAWAVSENENDPMDGDEQNTLYTPLDGGAADGQLLDFFGAWQLAAAEGGSVTLQQDVLVAAEDAPEGIFVQVPEDGEILLDLNGYRLEGEEVPCLIYVGARGKLTVTDGGQSGSQIIGVVGVDESADDPAEWGQLELLGDAEVVDPNVMMAAGDHSHTLSSTSNCRLDSFNDTINFDKELTLNELEKNTSSSGNYELHTGNYYLENNLVLDKTINIAKNATVNICLNGHEINGHKINDGSITNTTAPIIFQERSSNSTLHICDCSSGKTGQITSGTNTAILSGGGFYLHSGKITNNSAIEHGAGVRVVGENGVLHIYGGEISNNRTTDAKNGGGVHFGGKEFKFYGGSITNNSAAGNGGGILFSNLYTNELEMSDDVKIQGNTSGGTSNNNDIYFSIVQNSAGATPYILLTSALTGNGTDPIHIAISTLADDIDQLVLVKAENGVAVDRSQFNYSGDDRYKLVEKDNQLILQKTTAEYTPEDGDPQFGTFEDMWNLAAASGGTVKLLDNIMAVNGSFCTGDGTKDGTNDGFDYPINTGTGGIVVPQGKTITLDLNGKTIDRGLTSERVNGSVITVNGSLTIKDSSASDTNKVGTGTITGGYYSIGAGHGGGVLINQPGSLTMYAGNITNNRARFGGGVCISNGGTFNLYNGKISNNQACWQNNTLDTYGGGVYLSGDNSVLNFYDGEISNNTAHNGGGGIYNSLGSTVNMSGGNIVSNSSTASRSNGGGIMTFGNLNITGGLITKNSTIQYGGGVCFGGVEGNRIPIYTISGSPRIIDNSVENAANNVHIAGSPKITVKNLIDGAKIGVNATINIVNATFQISNEDKTVSDECLKYFFADDSENYNLIWDTNKSCIRLVKLPPPHKHALNVGCDDTITTGADLVKFEGKLSSDTSNQLCNDGTVVPDNTLTAGSYYVESDITLSSPITIAGDVKLCLNGHIIKQTGSNKNVIIIQSEATLSLCDCKTNETHSGLTGDISGLRGGLITGGNLSYTGEASAINGAGICNQGTFNMYGGTIAGNTSSSTEEGVSPEYSKGGGVYSSNTFNMYGGKISYNTGSTGGGIYNADSGNLTINAGSISFNSCSNGTGGGIYSVGLLTLNGGSISENLSKQGSGIYVVNNAKAPLQFSGNVAIAGNYGSDYSANNVYFEVGTNGSLRGAQVTGQLDPDARIGLSIEKPTDTVLVTSADARYFSARNFFLDDEDCHIEVLDSTGLVSKTGNLPFHEHYDMDLTAFMAISTISQSLSNGSYYLTGDITLSSPITISGTVDLCLNGHKITGPADGKPAFQVPSGAVLNIYNDEGADGFAGLSGSGGMEVAGGGTLNLIAKDAAPVTYTPAGGSGVKVTVDQTGTVTGTPVEGGGDPTPDGTHAQRHPKLAGATEINAGNFNTVTQENKPDGYTGALPAVTTAYRFLNPGQYYLEGNFTMPYALIALGNTDFCLNGSNLGADNDTWIYEMQHVFWVPEKAALNVLDCQRNLHIVWLYGGRVFLKKGAQVNISGNLPDYITTIEMAEDADGEVRIEYDVNKEPFMTLPSGATLTQKVPVKPGQTITQTITNRGGVLEMTTSETGTPTTKITPPSTEASINLKLPEPVSGEEAPNIVLEAPAGSTVQTGDGPEIKLEQPGEVAADGTVSSRSVTVPTADPVTGEKVQTTVTAPAGKTVQVTPDGESQAPAGSTVQTADGPKIQLEQPGEVAAGGTVSSRSVTVKTVDPETKEDVTIVIAAPADKTVQVTPDGETQAPAGSTVTVDDVAVKVEKIGGGGADSTVTVHPGGSVDLPAGSEAAVSSPKKDSVTIVIALPGEGGTGTLGMTGGGITPPRGSTVTTKTKKGDVTIVIALPWPEGGEAPEINFGDGGSLILPPGTTVTKDGKTETVTEDKNVLDPDTGELTDKEPENPDKPDKPGKPVNPNKPAGETEEITPDKPVIKPDVKVEMDDDGKITVTPTDPQKPPVVIKPQPPDQPGDTPPVVDEEGKVFIDTPFKVETEGGPDITAEKGGSVDPDGNVTSETVTVEQKKPDGTTESTTLTAPENDAVKVGPNGEAQVPVGTEVKQDDVAVTIDKVPDPTKPVPVKPDGSIDLPGGSQITVTPEQPQQPEYIVTIPDKGGEVKLDQDRPVITLPPGAKVVDPISGKVTTISGSGGTINLSTGEITGAVPTGGGSDRPSGGSSGGGSSPASYVITASASVGGEIFPDQRVTVRGGADQTFTITPAEGYAISDVLVDDESVGPVTSYTFRNVRSAHTIQALFAAEGTSGHGHPGGCPKDETCPIWPYTDSIPTDWYHDGVHYCIENGLMIGTAPVLWEPDIPLSRAMMAQVLYNRAGQPAVSGAGVFEDVDQCGYWPAITWGGRTGVLQGYGDGSYGPYDAITREQLATLLWRYAGQPAADGQLHFSDAAEVSDYAKQALNWASRQGVITGYPDGTFRPRDNASRAEAAQMIMRYFNL